MKITLNISILFTLLFVNSIVVQAQSPNKMSYQAVIRNGDGELIANHEVRTKISLLKGSPNGTKVYSEIHLSTTNANGLVWSVLLLAMGHLLVVILDL
jgi:hypothetical protein